MSVTALPTLNAFLNGTCAVLLATGFVPVRRRRVGAHRACMTAAFALSVAFLASYFVYHAQVGSVPFPGQGWIRSVYFSILISHTVLAVLVPPWPSRRSCSRSAGAMPDTAESPGGRSRSGSTSR